MAIILPPITIPEHQVYPEERSAELYIYAPVVGLAQIRIVNQHVERNAEGDPVTIGPVETNAPYTLSMLEFLKLCPELSDVPGRLSDAMDSMKLRMPDRVYVKQFPTLTSLSVVSGAAAGGNTIRLTGTNFGYTLAVIFGNAAPVMAQVPNRTTAYVVVPPGTGQVNVSVVLDGNVGTLPAAYTYLPRQPTLSSLSVPNGPATGGETLTLTGLHFSYSGFPLTVQFGVEPPVTATVISDTTATVVVPQGTAGETVDVTVAVDGNESTLLNAYSYDYLPDP